MGNPREELLRLVAEARDQAKAILTTLEQVGHPQTNESNGVYLGLVTVQKRLLAGGTAAPLAAVGADLEQLATLCVGKLAPLQVLLREAVGLARGGS